MYLKPHQVTSVWFWDLEYIPFIHFVHYRRICHKCVLIVALKHLYVCATECTLG